jgi:membrane-anchored glycerophosphoryl diester phosphodiesterase (GDPDase)
MFKLKFTIIIILGIILAIVSCIFVIKNFLVDYKGGDNGFKIVGQLLLIVVSLVCSLVSVWEGFGIVQLLSTLKTPIGLSENDINQLNQVLAEYTKDVNTSIIVGYVCFILAYLIFRSVQKEIQREIDRPKSRWDWNKIDKN